MTAPAASLVRTRDGRQTPVATWPAVGTRRGYILFSHGAMSAPASYERLADPWTQAGYEVRAPLHVDSTDHPDHARYPMSDSWRCRIEDLRAVSRSLGGAPYVAAGHSYGALAALALGGVAAERPPGVEGPLADPAAKAVIAFSPPGPTPTLVSRDGFAGLATPALVQTGTLDVAPVAFDPRWEAHMAAFEDAPPGDKYLLVLDGADHFFGGLICTLTEPGPPQETLLVHAAAIATEFLCAYGHGDSASLRRLQQAPGDSGPVRLRRK